MITENSIRMLIEDWKHNADFRRKLAKTGVDGRDYSQSVKMTFLYEANAIEDCAMELEDMLNSDGNNRDFDESDHKVIEDWAKGLGATMDVDNQDFEE